MAHPFGAPPALSKLIRWAEQNGCEVSLENRTKKEDGRSYRVLILERTETGSRAMIANPDFNEGQYPTMVSYFQRRLGIKTAFTEQPPVPPEDSSG